jgi:hypothetical protein
MKELNEKKRRMKEPNEKKRKIKELNEGTNERASERASERTSERTSERRKMERNSNKGANERRRPKRDGWGVGEQTRRGGLIGKQVLGFHVANSWASYRSRLTVMAWIIGCATC